jgi:hypothetical protein
MKEFDMRKRHLNGGDPCTRFQLEVIKLSKQRGREADFVWDFSRLLWDPYEIVTVSKSLYGAAVQASRITGAFRW